MGTCATLSRLFEIEVPPSVRLKFRIPRICIPERRVFINTVVMKLGVSEQSGE